jgi:CBS domain-containing protein
VILSGAACRAAARIMAELGVRHLPVVDGGRLVGMLSIRDVIDRDPLARGS